MLDSGGILMNCQVQGCRNEGINAECINGVYSGTYIEGSFCHCARHSRIDIEKARTKFREGLIANCSLVNPYSDVRRVCGLGKAAG